MRSLTRYGCVAHRPVLHCYCSVPLDQVRAVLDQTEDRLRFMERAVHHVEVGYSGVDGRVQCSVQGPEDSDRWREQFTDRPRSEGRRLEM